MTNLDQFESVFKAAEKTLFVHEAAPLSKVLVVTDMDDEASQRFLARVQQFLRTAGTDASAREWQLACAKECASIRGMLDHVKTHNPDVIVSYRNLFLPSQEHPYSLGTHLDVLTQATSRPVLVTPHPDWLSANPQHMQDTSVVMAITDHLAVDHKLVSVAANWTAKDGSLWLTHIEDQTTFDRYMRAIERIPSIDTDNAREEILKQLLKQPADFIESCQESLLSIEPEIHIKSEIVLGRMLEDYKRLIASHSVSLLAMNTKDEQQLAMHGMAYPLSVEMQELPLLLV